MFAPASFFSVRMTWWMARTPSRTRCFVCTGAACVQTSFVCARRAHPTFHQRPFFVRHDMADGEDALRNEVFSSRRRCLRADLFCLRLPCVLPHQQVSFFLFAPASLFFVRAGVPILCSRRRPYSLFAPASSPRASHITNNLTYPQQNILVT